MIDEHKIKEKIKASEFVKKIQDIGIKNIESTAHTFFRLSQKQRKIYTESYLKNIIFNQVPVEVGIEKNGNYSPIYTFNDGKDLLKVLMAFSSNKVYIVTFYILNKEQKKEFSNGKAIK